jgi:hypothetical protein
MWYCVAVVLAKRYGSASVVTWGKLSSTMTVILGASFQEYKYETQYRVSGSDQVLVIDIYNCEDISKS